MLSTGSKLFLGLTTAAFAALVIYGATQDFGALGGIGLSFLLVALAGLSVAVIWAREGDVSAMDEAAAATAAPVAGGLWPLTGAAGAALLVIGTVTDKRYFVAGIALVLIAIGEWTVQGWAERATADARANERVRQYTLHPLELPIVGSLVLVVMIYGFSRVMLAVSKSAGPVIFVVAAALIAVFGFLFANKPHLRSTMVGGFSALALVLVAAGGIAGAAAGERDELGVAFEEDHFSAAHFECDSPEATEADEKAGGAVAAKSNVWATFTYGDDGLTAREIAGSPGGVITIDRGNYVSVLFKNESAEERRLTIYSGTVVESEGGVDVSREELTCTRLIGEGKTALLTFRIPKSSVPDDPYYAFVPGDEDARVEIVVP